MTRSFSRYAIILEEAEFQDFRQQLRALEIKQERLRERMHVRLLERMKDVGMMERRKTPDRRAEPRVVSRRKV